MYKVLNILPINYKQAIQFIQVSFNRLRACPVNQKYYWNSGSIKAEPKYLKQNMLDQLIGKMYIFNTKVNIFSVVTY